MEKFRRKLSTWFNSAENTANDHLDIQIAKLEKSAIDYFDSWKINKVVGEWTIFYNENKKPNFKFRTNQIFKNIIQRLFLMKKLIKLSKDHYIIVDDSEILPGDYLFEDIGGTIFGPYEYGDIVQNARKITHSTKELINVELLSLLQVEKLIHGHDIDKLATDYAETDIYGDSWYLTGLYYGYVEGFRDSMELNNIINKDIYDFSDLIRKAYLKYGNNNWLLIGKEVMEAMKQKKWNITYENGELKLI